MLEFLNKCMILRETEESSVSASTSYATVEYDEAIGQNRSPTPTVPTNETPTVPINQKPTTPRETYSKKLKEVPAVEKEMTSFLKKASEVMQSQLASREEDDEDLAFFKSVLPTVRKLNQSQKFQFRMQVMHNLQILTTTPNVSRPYQVPGVPFHQPPGINSMSFQQPSSSSFSYQPQYPPPKVGLQQEASSSSYHNFQPPPQNNPNLQCQQPSLLANQQQYLSLIHI